MYVIVELPPNLGECYRVSEPDPQKSKGGSGESAGVKVYTAPGSILMCVN